MEYENSQMKVRCNAHGHCTKESPVKKGDRNGIFLVALLFNLYINSLVDKLKSIFFICQNCEVDTVLLYVDDVILFSQISRLAWNGHFIHLLSIVEKNGHKWMLFAKCSEAHFWYLNNHPKNKSRLYILGDCFPCSRQPKVSPQLCYPKHTKTADFTIFLLSQRNSAYTCSD